MSLLEQRVIEWPLEAESTKNMTKSNNNDNKNIKDKLLDDLENAVKQTAEFSLTVAETASTQIIDFFLGKINQITNSYINDTEGDSDVKK